MSLNYFPQISDLLDDKAITSEFHDIHQLFAEDALAVIQIPSQKDNSRDIGSGRNRQRILSCEELGHIPKNWTAIRLKGKEPKIEARLFSILTFNTIGKGLIKTARKG